MAAREIISKGGADVFIGSNREILPSRSIREWFNSWLATKKLEAAPATASRYEVILKRFTTHLGRKADRDIATLTVSDVAEFGDSLANVLSRNSANLAVKTLRVCIGATLKHGLLGP